MLDEMERSIHDALCVVKRVLESRSVVVGGGAVEVALSIYLENFATSLVSALVVCALGLLSIFKLVMCRGRNFAGAGATGPGAGAGA